MLASAGDSAGDSAGNSTRNNTGHSAENSTRNSTSVVEYRYRVIQSFPHATSVFTQGLEFHAGLLYESAGRRGQSKVFTRSLDSTQEIHSQTLENTLFAEGITLLNGLVYQLTWQSQRGFIYAADTLERSGEFSISGEGWGMTNNGRQLIISNGSAQLSFLNPDTFSVERQLTVTFDGKPLRRLNELEWIDGVIYANIWRSNWIVMIDPKTGQVIAKVRLNSLLPQSSRTASTGVLNGIAYDRQKQRLLVTGKYWPQLYHIELIP